MHITGFIQGPCLDPICPCCDPAGPDLCHQGPATVLHRPSTVTHNLEPRPRLSSYLSSQEQYFLIVLRLLRALIFTKDSLMSRTFTLVHKCRKFQCSILLCTFYGKFIPENIFVAFCFSVEGSLLTKKTENTSLNFNVFQYCVSDKVSKNFKNEHLQDFARWFFFCQIFIENFVL